MNESHERINCEEKIARDEKNNGDENKSIRLENNEVQRKKHSDKNNEGGEKNGRDEMNVRDEINVRDEKNGCEEKIKARDENNE